MQKIAHIPPGLGRHQAFGKRYGGWFFRWWCRMKVEGAEHVPLTGPVLLAANHRSMWDVPIHVVASPRPITFMAKRELYRYRFLGWSWHVLGGFPVNRNIADVRAVDTALALLERGEAVGIYPEGTRSRSGEMLPFLKGAAWLALKTGVPIVPCGLEGTGGPWWKRKRVTVRFGETIRVEEESDPRKRRELAQGLTVRLLDEITRLLV